MTNELQKIKSKEKKDLIQVVENRIEEMNKKNEISYPKNYSPQNALKSAWLILQEVQDRNKKPALEVCTKESISNALLTTVVLGLNPTKKQIYYIVYGNKLLAQPSYLGQIAATKRIPGVQDIFAQVVYKDDIFEYKIDGAKKIITKHEQKLENIDNSKIIAAYATIRYIEDLDSKMDVPTFEYSEIMTMAEIEQAWKQSTMRPFDDKGVLSKSTVHYKFTQEMAKKTVLNRTCKMFLGTSDDSGLLIEHLSAATSFTDGQEEDIDDRNSEIIDITDLEEVEEVEDIIEDDDMPTAKDNIFGDI
jgi:recombination protein RecT